MAQDITLLGASYQAVPAVTLPKTGGGTASFTDVTDTTAAAADVATGKYFYSAAGARTEGTSSGGGGGTDYLAQLLNNTITSYTSSEVTSVISRGFQSVSSLQSISLPNCLTIGSTAFSWCSNLQSVSMPRVTTVNSTAFEYSGVTTLAFPSMVTANNNSFQNARNLATLDMLGGTIGNTSFGSCLVLKTLILRKSDGVVTLNNINAFNGSPYASGGSGGTVYVPSALISSYKTATNWSTMYGYGTMTFAAIEDSQYKNYYADGTPVA